MCVIRPPTMTFQYITLFSWCMSYCWHARKSAIDTAKQCVKACHSVSTNSQLPQQRQQPTNRLWCLAGRDRTWEGDCPGGVWEAKCLMGMFGRGNVRIPMLDYKSLHVAVMICADVVNTSVVTDSESATESADSFRVRLSPNPRIFCGRKW